MKKDNKSIKTNEAIEQQNLKNKIKFLSSQREFKDALKFADEYLKEYPNDYYMVAYKVTLLFKNNLRDEARELAKSILELTNVDNQSKEFVYEALAIAETAEDDYMSAIEHWRICVDLMAPKVYNKGICNMAILYNVIGEEEKALELVKPREDYNPEIFNVTRARILYESDKCYEALEELDRKTTTTDREYALKKAEAQKCNMHGLICEKLAEKETPKKKQELQKEALDWFKKVRQTISSDHLVYWDSLLHTAILTYDFGNDTESRRICGEILKKCTNERIASSTISFLASDRIKNFDFDEAEKEYDKHTNEIRKALGYAKVSLARYDFKNAHKILSSIQTLNEDLMFAKNCLMAQVMFRKNDYSEFLKYYQLATFAKPANKSKGSIAELNRMLMILETVNNLPVTREVRTYYEKQIVSYDETTAIEHTIYAKDTEAEKENFGSNIDIEKLYSDVKDYLDKDRSLCDGIYDKYIVDMSKIGEIKDNLRFVTVVCLANTKKIIKIYPSNHYVGIFVEPTSVQPVQKTRLSAMDKFKKKYGM